MNTNENQTNAGRAPVETGVIIKVGLDVHAGKRRKGSCLNCFRHFSELFVQSSDSHVVVLVVAGHVENWNARKRLPCLHDAFDSAVEIPG
jgi:hypothetical protein